MKRKHKALLMANVGKGKVYPMPKVTFKNLPSWTLIIFNVTGGGIGKSLKHKKKPYVKSIKSKTNRT